MIMGFTNSDYVDEILQKALYMGISDKVFDEAKKIMDSKQISFYDSVVEAYDLILKDSKGKG
jgi:hypothetical protein